MPQARARDGKKEVKNILSAIEVPHTDVGHVLVTASFGELSKKKGNYELKVRLKQIIF